MATRKRTGNKQPVNDPAFKSAVKAATKKAETAAETGNVATVAQDEGGPNEVADTGNFTGTLAEGDHITGTRRSHPAE